MASLLDRLSLIFAYNHAKRTYQKFVAAARNATAVQQRVLRSKIRIFADSDFARKHRFDRIRDYHDFARLVPICTYDDLRPYIEQVKAGNTAALLGRQKVIMFALTSGTTAEPKYIPVTPQFLSEYKRGWNAWGLKALMDHPAALLRSILQVASPMDEHYTQAGIPCGAITGLTARTQKRLVRRYYATPQQTAYIGDAVARYYTIMRFAIARDVAWLIAANPSTLLRLAESADAHKETLIRDLADGTLTPPGQIAPELLADLRRLCRPDRSRARQLERLAERHGRLRPQDYWQLEFIACWTGGTMGLHLQYLKEWFGDLPVRDVGLIASEGRMSVPVEDDTPAGILEVTSHFYEFIPADQIESQHPDVLLCHQLQVGAEYYIILTTCSGLWRYNIFDLIRVTGYFGEAPIIEFLSKGERIASLTGEKLTENHVVLAAESVERHLGVALGNFAVCPRWGSPPYYVLYIDERSQVNTEAVARQFDSALCEVNGEYASKRKSLRLGPIRCLKLAAGYLDELDRAALQASRGRAEQFKHRFLYTRLDADRNWPILTKTDDHRDSQKAVP